MAVLCCHAASPSFRRTRGRISRVHQQYCCTGALCVACVCVCCHTIYCGRVSTSAHQPGYTMKNTTDYLEHRNKYMTLTYVLYKPTTSFRACSPCASEGGGGWYWLVARGNMMVSYILFTGVHMMTHVYMHIHKSVQQSVSQNVKRAIK